MSIQKIVLGAAIIAASSLACSSSSVEPPVEHEGSTMATSTALTTPIPGYLHADGRIDATTPTGATAATKDSAGMSFAGGNPWVEVGTWTAAPSFTSGVITSFGDVRLWLGLKNSDDVGTRFDVGVEIFKNGTLVGSGTSYCVQGLVRNAAQAKAVTVSVPSFGAVAFDGTTDYLWVHVVTRIGTDADTGASCGGHSNATGLRSYLDAATRQAGFDMSLTTHCTGDDPDADCPKIACTTREFRLINNLWVEARTIVEPDVWAVRVSPFRVDLYSSGMGAAQRASGTPQHYDAGRLPGVLPPTPSNDYSSAVSFTSDPGGLLRAKNVGGLFELGPTGFSTRPFLSFMYSVTCAGTTSIRSTPPSW